MRKALLLSVMNAIALLSGCGSAVEDGSGESAQTSATELRLVDTSANSELSNVVLNVSQIEFDIEGKGWSTVSDHSKKVSMGGGRSTGYQTLGTTELPSGHVKRIRIHTDEQNDSYVVTRSGTKHTIGMPSAEGMTFNAGFDLEGCSKGYISIDFNSAKTVSSANSCTCHDWTMSETGIRLHAVVSVGTCDKPTPNPTPIPTTPPTKPGSTCDTRKTPAPPATTPYTPPPPAATPPVEDPPSTTPESDPTTPTTPVHDSCAKVSCAGNPCINGLCAPPIVN